MSETILRSEAMKLILSGQPFSMEFVTADRRRGTGGELKEVKQWMIVKNDPTVAEKLPGKNESPGRKNHKDPQHHLHKTFNIFNPAMPNERPYKVHYRLIQSLNGKRVLNG